MYCIISLTTSAYFTYLGRYFVKISGEVNTMGNAFYFCMPDNGMMT